MREFESFEGMAMLELSDAERVRIKERFDALVDGFCALDAFEVDGVEPLVSVLDLRNVMREDVASKLMTRDELLANAPEQLDGYFQVPATID